MVLGLCEKRTAFCPGIFLGGVDRAIERTVRTTDTLTSGTGVLTAVDTDLGDRQTMVT